ncbi:ABC transporter ATP-binding protein [Thiocapsa imhoffii]|uniref:ABC transporter ATP-binding protein n=1 Tax=Thiocapsa imhoffii TaxID=382777 RepID=A0A9X0WMY4_9GAMM|nr:ABC transporter ATP-binding protein [Thiocapsa imhoffii]MBK1646792.1 ABC transporter ATP-binding protein [Thiocapsa imhoffii]
MNTFQKAIHLLTPRERRRGLLVLVLVLGMALLETAGVASVMPFLAVLGNPEMLETNPVLSALYNQGKNFGIDTPDQFLIALGLAAFALMVFSAVYRTLTHYAMNRFIEMRRHTIGARLLEAYLRQPYAFFLDRHSGDMSKSILSEVDQLVQNVFRPAYNMIAYSLVLIAITTLLILVNPWIALLAAGLLGGLYGLVYLVVRRYLGKIGQVRVATNKQRFMAASETFGGIKDIKLLGHEQSYLSRFKAPSQRFASTQASYQTLNQVPNFLIEAIIFGAMLLLTVVLLITHGGLGSSALGQILPILGLYAIAAYRMKPAAQKVFNGFASLRYGHAAVNSLYADLHPQDAPALLPKLAPKPLKAQNIIALEHLSYTYPNAAKAALSDLNLRIPVGSAVGLVGSTGAGKTTLVDVILGLLHPTEGAITVDGVPVTEHNLRAWQQSLGYVPQEIFLTDTTVAENVALGVPKENIDHEQVEHCARMAQVHDFIMHELPEQYSTLVGERGVRLSGGQRQRIGIARALYRNPELLVFDEATSALDNLTEQAVMDAVHHLGGEITIVMIAHRLSTVRECDHIYLLEQGKLAGQGNYEELVANNTRFRSMAEA